MDRKAASKLPNVTAHRRLRRNQRGITLTECAVAVAILGSCFLLAKSGMQILHTVARQRSTVEIQQQAQLAVYSIARDIRNSKDIGDDLSHDRLVLHMFNNRNLSFNDPNRFISVNVGTVTYRYVADDRVSYLERKEEFPGGDFNVRKMLTNSLLPPTETEYIFKGGPNITPPWDSVDIAIRLKPILGRTQATSFESVSVTRAGRHGS